MAGSSGFSGSDGSIGPGGHLRHLDLVVGAMRRARCVPNGRWRGSFFAEIPMSEGGSAACFWPPHQSKRLEFQV